MSVSRQDLRNAINAVAFSQAGYFTAAQAIEAGYSYQAQKHHADRGNWVRVDRGLYRLPQWPTAPDDNHIRWSVWSAGRAVVSHESALSVHGLSDAAPGQLHLTVPPGFGSRDSAVHLHKRTLSQDDIHQRQGWAVTTPLRTLIDIGESSAPQETIDRAVAGGLHLGAFSRRDILAAADTAQARSALRIVRALAAVERKL